MEKEAKTARGDNLILIGMPASGKSTCGVILAKVLGYDFLDSDLIIQKKTGKRLSELIEERGVDGFIALENEINVGISPRRTVIATGGSAVYGTEAMEHFRRIGLVLYLDAPFEELEKRLGNIRQRGVVLREGQDFRGLYEERVPLYRKYADHVIVEKETGTETTLSEILQYLEEQTTFTFD